MTSRMYAAGILALGIGAMGASVETWAGSAGGLASAPSLPASSVAGPAVARAPFAHTFQQHRMTRGLPLHVNGSRMARMRSPPTAVCAIELVIFARSCTGLKNLLR